MYSSKIAAGEELSLLIASQNWGKPGLSGTVRIMAKAMPGESSPQPEFTRPPNLLHLALSRTEEIWGQELGESLLLKIICYWMYWGDTDSQNHMGFECTTQRNIICTLHLMSITQSKVSFHPHLSPLCPLPPTPKPPSPSGFHHTVCLCQWEMEI